MLFLPSTWLSTLHTNKSLLLPRKHSLVPDSTWIWRDNLFCEISSCETSFFSFFNLIEHTAQISRDPSRPNTLSSKNLCICRRMRWGWSQWCRISEENLSAIFSNVIELCPLRHFIKFQNTVSCEFISYDSSESFLLSTCLGTLNTALKNSWTNPSWCRRFNASLVLVGQTAHSPFSFLPSSSSSTSISQPSMLFLGYQCRNRPRIHE